MEVYLNFILSQNHEIEMNLHMKGTDVRKASLEDLLLQKKK